MTTGGQLPSIRVTQDPRSAQSSRSVGACHSPHLVPVSLTKQCSSGGGGGGDGIFHLSGLLFFYVACLPVKSSPLSRALEYSVSEYFPLLCPSALRLDRKTQRCTELHDLSHVWILMRVFFFLFVFGEGAFLGRWQMYCLKSVLGWHLLHVTVFVIHRVSNVVY